MLLRGELNRVSFRADLAPDLPRLSGDRVQLQQVLINLVMNGIEAMRSLMGRPRELLIKSARIHDEVSFRSRTLGGSIRNKRSMSLSHSLPPSLRVLEWDCQSAGLSVESDGGRLWAESGSKGAIFQFTLSAR